MSILDEVNKIIQSYDDYKRELNYVDTKIYDCDANIAVLSKKKDVILASKTYYKKAIDILYQNSIKELEDLINDVMAAVFYDRNLKVRMELTDSRSKSLLWYIIDEDEGIQMSVNGVGRGIRTVLSFIIQSYYLLSLGSKCLFIDEGYSYISESYVDKFFEFVRLLCKEKDLSLVMISHDERFSGYADYNYNVIKGRIQECIRDSEKGESGEESNKSLCTKNS